MNQICHWSRHSEVNHIIKRVLVSAKIPTILDPCNLSVLDGKRPDGLTNLSWKQGEPLIWDFTVADTLCNTNVKSFAKQAGSAAKIRAQVSPEAKK